MPEKLEQKLIREARKKGLTGKKFNAYVYGTMRRTGWKPERELMNKQAKQVVEFITLLDKVAAGLPYEVMKKITKPFIPTSRSKPPAPPLPKKRKTIGSTKINIL